MHQAAKSDEDALKKMNFIQVVERLCKARDVPVVKLDVSVRPFLALLLGGLAKCFLVQQFGSVYGSH
jgi:hypothetical protein